MKHFILNATLDGAGIQENYNGEFLNPDELLLCQKIVEDLKIWISRYQKEICNEDIDYLMVCDIEREGICIARKIKNELPHVRIEYLSDILMIEIY
ncbi:hypothetical protein [Dyadobacter sp. CY323]|uniref:hypothetical protein n=1 Tax=Dyadobacter sp. CY323 TaxID=2907302 RepID=UPI001F22215A|nr:hypothetical protein [Dyadobacter sp. CY323]MCE6993046.1 hypothetical protein [Dyadobacter sp. CY323]